MGRDINNTEVKKIIRDKIPYEFHENYTKEQLDFMRTIIRSFEGAGYEDRLEKYLMDFVIAESIELSESELMEDYKKVLEDYKEHYEKLVEIKNKEGISSKAYLKKRDECYEKKTRCNKRKMQLDIKPWTQCNGHIMVKYNDQSNCGCIKCGYPYLLNGKKDDALASSYKNSSCMCVGLKNNIPNLYLYGFTYDFDFVRRKCKDIILCNENISNEELIEKLKELLDDKRISYKVGR